MAFPNIIRAHLKAAFLHQQSLPNVAEERMRKVVMERLTSAGPLTKQQWTSVTSWKIWGRRRKGLEWAQDTEDRSRKTEIKQSQIPLGNACIARSHGPFITTVIYGYSPQAPRPFSSNLLCSTILSLPFAQLDLIWSMLADTLPGLRVFMIKYGWFETMITVLNDTPGPVGYGRVEHG